MFWLNKPLLISLEGVDGCGKTTQAALVYDFFIKNELRCKLTREPGGTALGAALRKNLLELKNLDALTQLYMIMADRNQHWVEVIKPALSSGFSIISERSWVSTLAYQGFGMGVDLDLIKTLNSSTKPDICIYLDIPPEKALERIEKKDVIESMGVEFYNHVREGYLYACSLYDNVFLVDASRSKKDVNNSIIELLLKFASR